MESIEIIVGTYENMVLGFRTVQSVANNNCTLETSFTDDAHRGALRCLSVSSNGILASSSTDDSVRLHSLKRRKEIGGVFQHTGTVNCLTFYGKGYMFSASEDGTICMWKSKNWELLRTLKGHKAKVMTVGIHPTGKLGFSAGSDKSLLTWDLLTGKLAFQRKLQDVALSIFFTPSGDRYVLQFDRRIEICDIEDTKTVNVMTMDWRINCLVLVKQDFLVVGGEDRHVQVLNLTSGKTVLTLDSADQGQSDFHGRVKSVQVLEENENSALVFIGTAQGHIKAFKVDLTEGSEEAELVLSYDAGVRLTCMAVYRPGSDTQQKETEGQEEKQLSRVKKAKRRSDDINNEEGEEESDTQEEESTAKVGQKSKSKPKQNGKPQMKTSGFESTAQPVKKQRLEKVQRTSETVMTKKKKLKGKKK
ncbi:p21-activated protein kinase-interacting protein 1-like isoform X2 [Aplysia californica]|uniref:P21-activated protein kinase-interacting protein 1-like isoform X2 n=1 Tax=Aplysia californica TaxID=6500 RepID=A0ABM1A0F8_APLCA|nr:p21-activated protein kinase-interacting protein 1-like isoform X2 [Aplysia californica]